MTELDSKFYKKKKSSPFYGALIFLFAVIFLSGGLYYYNITLEKKNTDIQTSIVDKDEKILELQADKNIDIYSMYDRHKALLYTLGEQSKVPEFARHLQQMFVQYGISGTGFEYHDGTIEVEMQSETGNTQYGYERIVNMLGEYSQSEEALFELGNISDFAGHDKISYTAIFNLK